jgi:hypothetical protein
MDVDAVAISAFIDTGINVACGSGIKDLTTLPVPAAAQHSTAYGIQDSTGLPPTD